MPHFNAYFMIIINYELLFLKSFKNVAYIFLLLSTFLFIFCLGIFKYYTNTYLKTGNCNKKYLLVFKNRHIYVTTTSFSLRKNLMN